MLPFFKFTVFSNGCKFSKAQHCLNSWSSGEVYLGWGNVFRGSVSRESIVYPNKLLGLTKVTHHGITSRDVLPTLKRIPELFLENFLIPLYEKLGL